MTVASSMHKDEAGLRSAYTTGAGFGWHEHHDDLFAGTERFFRPGYAGNLVPSWIPALDGVAEQADGGGRRRRRRVRARRVDDPAGRGVPEQHGGRRRLPPRVDRDRPPPGRRRRARRTGPLRGGPGRRLRRLRLRPGLRLRRPPRHGRPRRRRRPHPRRARRGRDLAARGAERRRPPGGQPRAGRADLLLGLVDDLHAGVSVPARGARASAPRPATPACARSWRPAGSPASVGPPRRPSTRCTRSGPEAGPQSSSRRMNSPWPKKVWVSRVAFVGSSNRTRPHSP